MSAYELRTGLLLPRPLPEVFAFFAEAANLEALTPPWLRFEILSPQPLAMAPGTMIDYRLRLHGIPVRWRSEITLWEPPHRFVDEQRKGPYRSWHHEHTFAAEGSGTRVADRVRYAVPGGALVHRLFVRSQVRGIFTYRHEALRRIFGSVGGGEPEPVTIGRV